MKVKIKIIHLLFLVIGLSMIFGYLGSYLALQLHHKSVSIPISHTSNMPQISTNSIQDIVRKASQSVVEIKAKTNNNHYTSNGSGVIVSTDGYIATNNHVVEHTTDVVVKLYNGEQYDATIIATDPKTDLAVLKIDKTDLIAASFADSGNLAVGDFAMAIGNPLGTLGGTVTDGIISALDRELILENEPMNLLQTNAQINQGNSGGGLFNANGELIGIVVAKTTGKGIEGIGFAIPSNDALEIIEQLIEKGYVANRPTIGVRLKTLNLQQEQALFITEVFPNSAASEAGLQVNDQIIKFNNQPIRNYLDLRFSIRDLKINDTVEVIVLRDNKEVILQLTLKEATK
ncbi:PDZ domain-containing protein [Erysipelotrichaceae bacterium OH741_COT-311]|nr:PDZ domain-containing protein [Erysipelotrichaceae bacterium OH741_COT-311]